MSDGTELVCEREEKLSSEKCGYPQEVQRNFYKNKTCRVLRQEEILLFTFCLYNLRMLA